MAAPSHVGYYLCFSFVTILLHQYGLHLVHLQLSQSGWTTCSWAPPSLLPGREYPEKLNILTTLPDRLFFGPECPRILLVWFDIVHWEYLGRLNPFTTLPDRFKYLWTIISLVVTVMPTCRLRIYGEVEHLEYGAECDIRMDFDTNEYPNIFVSRKWHERISEYIRMKFFETNEYTNIFVSKFLYERISE